MIKTTRTWVVIYNLNKKKNNKLCFIQKEQLKLLNGETKWRKKRIHKKGNVTKLNAWQKEATSGICI